MKSKLLKSIGIAILCLAIVLGNVLAFSLSTTDGVWGLIDSIPNDGFTDDASCSAWGRATNTPYTIWDVLGVIYNTNVGPGGEDEQWVRNSDVCSGDVDGDKLFYNDASFGGWTYASGTPTWANFGAYSGCSNATGLFISKYGYDSRDGNDRVVIEIYNGTGEAVNLATYKLLLFTSDRDLTQVQLNNVSLAAGDVWVVSTESQSILLPTPDQEFLDSESYRTIVLIQNYDPQVINATNISDPVTVQGVSLTDENQVRYGRPDSGYTSCPGDNDLVGFNRQSGFGFEGIEVEQSEISEGAYFPVGRFCHYNNPITIANDGNNYFNQVPLNLTINNIACDTGWTRQGSGNLTFNYLVNLTETPNNGSNNICEFGPGDPQWPAGGSANPYVNGDLGPNRNGCADGVNFTSSSSTQTFTCRNNSSTPDNPIEQDYTVSILGFTATQAGGVCPSQDHPGNTGEPFSNWR